METVDELKARYLALEQEEEATGVDLSSYKSEISDEVYFIMYPNGL